MSPSPLVLILTPRTLTLPTSTLVRLDKQRYGWDCPLLCWVLDRGDCDVDLPQVERRTDGVLWEAVEVGEGEVGEESGEDLGLSGVVVK